MVDDVEYRIARAPMQTVRAADFADSYRNPSKELSRRVRAGKLHRLASGYYCLVPPGEDPSVWQPTLETSGAAIATAILDDRVPILIGMSAARVHQAYPRAISEASVAVPTQHKRVVLSDRRAGTITFAQREVGLLDASLVRLELGHALVSSPAETILELARAAEVGPREREAIAALWGKTDLDIVEGLTEGRPRLRPALARAAQFR